MNWIKPTVCILRKKHSEPLGVNKVFHLKCCVVKQESETVNQPFCFWVMLKKQKKSLNYWNTCLRIQGFNREIVQSVWKKVFNTWIQRNIFAFILRSLKMQCALQTFQWQKSISLFYSYKCAVQTRQSLPIVLDLDLEEATTVRTNLKRLLPHFYFQQIYPHTSKYMSKYIIGLRGNFTGHLNFWDITEHRVMPF